MQYEGQDTQRIQLQPLSPESQNNNQQLIDQPPQQQEQQQPNPEGQNQNQIQQINKVPEEISNINDLYDYEDQNILMIQVGNVYHLPPQQLEQQQNQNHNQIQQINNFLQQTNINGLCDYEDQYILMDNIQIENVYEDEDQHEENSLIPVLHIYDQDQLIRIEINKSITYIPDSNRIYVKNRKMLSKQVTLKQKYENQSECE